MKKFVAVLTVALLLCGTLSACKSKTEAADTSEPASMPDYIDIVADDSDVTPADQVAGGWTTPEDGTITAEAQAAFDKAVKPGGMAYTPVALVGTQVVAGTNYALVCIGKGTAPEAKPSPYLVIVYADLNGGAKILSSKLLAVGQ